jgi:sensor c-di-GMP phosphodiesterase-like protein
VPTGSMIEYGTTRSLGRRSGSHELRQDHTIRLLNLDSHSTYYARVAMSNGDATATSQIFTFKTMDAGAGITAGSATINPEFDTHFNFSSFNFKDFPLDDLQASASAQASSGAVLADIDEGPMEQMSNRFGNIIASNPWLIWLWIPILLLLGLIITIWLLTRHARRMERLHRAVPKL